MADIFELFKKISTGDSTASRTPITHLVVGLGNPGEKYQYTRHNAGFLFLDTLCNAYGVRMDRARYHGLCREVTVGESRVLLLKPQTMMNLSGESVAAAASFYKLPPERVIVVYDDISLAVAQLRVRRKGSAGGHNGIKSIIEHLGSEEFPRIKVGVGQKPHPDYDLAAWVLSDFTVQEREALRASFAVAKQGMEKMLQGDVDAAMQLCNAHR